MTRVYISYRSSDAAVVRQIYRRAVLAYGNRNVLLNPEDTVPLNTPLENYIENIISGCHVVLIVIGPQWAGIDEYGRFLLSSADVPIQPEVVAAIKNAPRIINVLVNGVQAMPAPDELPENLQPLYDEEIVILRPQHFQADLARLIKPPSPLRVLQYGLTLEWLKQRRIG